MGANRKDRILYSECNHLINGKQSHASTPLTTLAPLNSCLHYDFYSQSNTPLFSFQVTTQFAAPINDLDGCQCEGRGGGQHGCANVWERDSHTHACVVEVDA